MIRTGGRGVRILGGVEPAVAGAACAAVTFAVRSAFHRGLAQTFTPPPPDFPYALALKPPPARTQRPDSLSRRRSFGAPADGLPASRFSTRRLPPPSTLCRFIPGRTAPSATAFADAQGPDGRRTGCAQHHTLGGRPGRTPGGPVHRTKEET